MSNERDSKSDSVQFRVVDPPTVPLVPSGPPRALFLSMVLVAAVGAAFAFAFVRSTMEPAESTLSPRQTTARRRAFALAVLLILGTAGIAYLATSGPATG